MLEISMATFKDSQAILADKEAYYENVTRLIRWLGIAIVVVTFSPHHPLYWLLLMAVLIGTGFNLLRYSRLMRWPWFASRITTLVADNLLIAALVLLSGGLHSPYIIFWVFTIISAAYWYGQGGISLVLSWEILILAVSWLLHGQTTPSDDWRLIALESLSLVALAVLAERLTHVDRNERGILAQANRSVETERQRLVALINSLADPVIAIDTNNRISLYNGAALDLLNTNQALEGQNLDRFLHLEDAKGQPVPLASLLDQPGILKRNDLLLRLSEGSLANLDISVAPIHTESVTQDSYIFILRDVTKQKSLDQERDEFISVTSHELRTPVAIAEANLSTALLPTFDSMGPKAHELVNQAHQNIVFLGQLIKDLSTLSRAEQSRLKIEFATVDPAALIHQLAEDYQATASAKGLTIKTKVAKEVAPLVTGVELVHEILQNFITNALKYTEQGGLTLVAEANQEGPGVTFSVSDTGIGISASDKKKLFTKFYRSEDYRTRKTKGTGLGLYITLKLAQRLGAKIWFKSQLNRGSTFYLQVPSYREAIADHPQVVSASARTFFEG